MMRNPFPVFALAGAVMACGAFGQGCSSDDACLPSNANSAGKWSARLKIVDEGGKSLDAKVTIGEEEQDADGGEATISATTAKILIVSAPGHLDEPVVLGPTDNDKDITVRLWASAGRIAVHSVGDVMMGRRYETPKEGPALVPKDDPTDGARKVLEAIKPLYLAADARTMNLETVVSDMDEGNAYPGKRFILRTRPGVLPAIKDMQPTAVDLANNHSRDYLDDGIGDTLKELDKIGLPHLGATIDDAPEAPLVVPIKQTKIGLAAFTTVDGAFVNEAYPSATQKKPAALDPKDAFQYEERTWFFEGTSFAIPSAERRIGAAWTAFRDNERGAAAAAAGDVTGAYTSLAKVYPEIQDWVARRGHGGARFWNKTSSTKEIQALKAGGAELVIVQLHAGYQFAEAPSINVQEVAEQAIEAGADLVVCHHPHVVQGLSFVKGKLVAYSLGNFVFDQDFLSTFTSTVLRTVWEGNKMLEARLYPVEIDNYRPYAATGAAARGGLNRMWERSLLRSFTDRDPASGNVVASSAQPREGVVPAQLVYEGNSARVVPDTPKTGTADVSVPGGGWARLDIDGLVDPRLGGDDGIEVGRDLLGFGRFEGELADEKGSGATHWDIGQCEKQTRRVDNRGVLSIKGLSIKGGVFARPTARIPISYHRFRDALGAPLDPAPTFSVHLHAKVDQTATIDLRLDRYHFDDQNPTEDPESELLGKTELAVDVPEKFSDVWVDIPAADLEEKSGANLVMLYIKVRSASDIATLDIDTLEFVEWRKAQDMHDRFGQYDLVRNKSKGAVELSVPFLAGK